jgi:hypothetical protein
VLALGKRRRGMKKHFRVGAVLTTVLLLIFPAAKTSFAQVSDPKPLLGTWDIEVLDMGFQLQFVFKIVEEVLTGELVFEMGGGKMENIKLEKNELSCFVSLDVGGQSMGIDITGTIDGEKITGYLNSDMGSAQYSGTKRKE